MTEGEEEVKDLTYDEACLILVHAITMTAIEINYMHPVMLHVMARALEAHGFPNEKGAAILEGAFRLIKRVDEATELLEMVAIDDGKEKS